MKKYKLELLFIFSVVATLIIALFTACDDHNGIDNPRMMQFDSPQYSIIDYNDVRNAIEDAGIDNDMMFNSIMLNYGFMNANGFTQGSELMRANTWLAEFDGNKNIGWILRSLDLTSAQRDSIDTFIITYHDSMKTLVKSFYNEIKDTIQSANIQRHVIIDSLRNGQINLRQAGNDLTALNIGTRNKIQNDPLVQSIKNDMCEQRTNLFNNIGSVLTAEQLTKWNNMISKIKSPC